MGHHHTFTHIDGLDYQILVEADFLVNADESHYDVKTRNAFYQKVFRTKAGKQLFKDMYESENQ